MMPYSSSTATQRSRCSTLPPLADNVQAAPDKKVEEEVEVEDDVVEDVELVILVVLLPLPLPPPTLLHSQLFFF